MGTVNRASHKQLVAVLTGSSSGSVSTKGGRITIDLSKVEASVKQKLDARGITIFDHVPAVKGLNYVLFQSNDLVRNSATGQISRQAGGRLADHHAAVLCRSSRANPQS